MLKKKDKELKYKTDPGLDFIKIFDVEKVKTKFITIDVLWCLTTNSPNKYMHLQIPKKKIAKFEKVALNTINHTLRTLGDPKVTEKSFRLSKRCLCNC